MGENYHKKESKPAVRAIGEEQLARSNWRGAIGEASNWGPARVSGGGLKRRGGEPRRRWEERRWEGTGETLGS